MFFYFHSILKGGGGVSESMEISILFLTLPLDLDITVNIYLLQAPGWWKTPLMGPAFSSGMVGAVKEPKSPGCNGGVCYCNDKNFCNDRSVHEKIFL